MKPNFLVARVRAATSALVLACLALNPMPRAHAQTSGTSSLSPAAQARFARQLRSLQAFRKGLSPTQRKLPPSLLLAKPSGARTRASLPRFGRGRGLQSLQQPQSVLIYGQMTPRIKAAIEREGTLTGFFPESGVASARLTVTALEHIASATEIKSVIFNPGPYTKQFRPSSVTSQGITPRAGGIVSEGDKTHQAEQARTEFKVAGAGFKIGVISDSAESLKKLQTAGELPADVKILPGQGGEGSSEGTAMMEIIHDLAPEAKLVFSTSGNTPEQMARNILALQKDGCKIIVDDIGFVTESVFQEDVVSAAIRQVSALGVVYLTAIGNDGNRALDPTSSWDGFFVNGATATEASFGDGGAEILNDWNSKQDYFNLVNGGSALTSAVLAWADPNGKSSNDYNLYDVGPDGDIVNSSDTVQDGNDQPQEVIFGGIDDGDSIVVTRASNSKLLPVRLFLFSRNTQPTLEHSVGPTGYGHGVAEFAVCVGASPALKPGPFPEAFSAKSTLEPFSSTGPRTLFFTSNGQEQTRLIKKPDIVAADNVSCATTGFNPFYGTSAAAPHAAAIAALAWSATPNATADQIKTRLLKGVIDIGKPGFEDDSGNGIVMVPLVLKNTDPTPTPAPTTTPIPTATPRPTPGPTPTPGPPPAGSIAFSEPVYSVRENAGTATILVHRIVRDGEGDFGAVSVKFQTTTGGSATANADYRTVTGILSWADGDSRTKTFSVPILDDRTREPGETVFLRIYDLSGRGTLAPSRKTATLTILDNETGDVDRVSPKVVITRPANDARVSNVDVIAGTASDEGGSLISSVVLFIQRPGDRKYWNGTEWVGVRTPLATTLGSNSRGVTWFRSSGNPTRSDLNDDFLSITAVATDGAGNTGQATSLVFVDSSPPQVFIFSPAKGARLRSLTRATGTVSDGAGDSTIVVFLRRASDRKFWTGQGNEWSSTATPLAVQLAPSGEWSRSQWPALITGNYSLIAVGTDQVGNRATATNEFTIGTPNPGTGSGGGS